MSTLTTRKAAIQNIAKGLGFFNVGSLTATAVTSSGAANSGFFTCQMRPNVIGTTLASTLQGIVTPTPASSAELLLSWCMLNSSSTTRRSAYLAWFYRFGTLTVTSTGDNFTADSATFPMKRTDARGANSAVNLIPIIHVTTAITVTSPAFILKKSDGSSGYVNQNGGSGIVGTKTFTMPATTIARDSAYILRLEDGDGSVQKIQNIDVTTASTAGAADIWGAELICSLHSFQVGMAAYYDAFFCSIAPRVLIPAAATSGTPTQFLGLLDFAGPDTTGTIVAIGGAVNA